MEKNALVFAKKIKVCMNKQFLLDIFVLFAHRFNYFIALIIIK